MSDPIEVTGRTQCVPGRKAAIAPTVLDAVVAVLVAAGDRVTKDQELVKLDATEQEADVRAKRAALTSAEQTFATAQTALEAIEGLWAAGNASEAAYRTVQRDARIAEQDRLAAQADLEASEAELKGYIVTAPLAGVVSWLDVCLGMVSRPGTVVWGEILDLSELDVRCELTPEQADLVAVGQAAEVRASAPKGLRRAGKVVFVGPSAGGENGLVPVLVRVANPKERLRCGVAAQVRFTEAAQAGEGR
jgi:RND family efflux transporter MFP subunit